MKPSAAAARLRDEAAKRVLLTDGAFGTMIQSYKLTEADYRGELVLSDDQKGNNDLLVLTRPDVIDAITRQYLDAGSDIVSTNTFNANTISQGDYNAVHLVRDMNLAAARIARAAADDYAARATAACASSPGRSGRPTRRCRCRPTSTIPAFAPSASTRSRTSMPIRRRRCSTAGSTSS